MSESFNFSNMDKLFEKITAAVVKGVGPDIRDYLADNPDETHNALKMVRVDKINTNLRNFVASDTVELKNYDNVYGIKMPDGIAVKVIGGKTYVLTANEGDSRADWPGMDNESEGKTSPTGSVTLDSKVVWFNASMLDGLDDSKAYVFGGRSFSMYEVASDGLKLVYDSGSSLEEITAQKLPQYFNCSNDKISLDNRSGKKGPEPETVTTGVIDGKTYAFMAI